MKKLMLSGVALGVLVSAAAQAQVQSGPGFFGYIDGMYVMPARSGGTAFVDQANTNVNPGDGWGAGAEFGYRFDGAWDI
ncbi:MAG: hypothetical protein JNL07_11915, partial [Rhodospirillales bacterium]|nr:hypothetical protein [Rhodospirillales bacterium]